MSNDNPRGGSAHGKTNVNPTALHRDTVARVLNRTVGTIIPTEWSVIEGAEFLRTAADAVLEALPAPAVDRTEKLVRALDELYRPEGVRFWWRTWLDADAQKRDHMERALLIAAGGAFA